MGLGGRPQAKGCLCATYAIILLWIASMEKVREELICAVCLEFLRDPKVLQCAHSFCTKCLSKIINGQKGNRQSKAVRPVDLECPSCRHVTTLERGRVELDLRTNFNLKRLVEIVSEEEKSRTLKVCTCTCTSSNSVYLTWLQLQHDF